MLNKKIAFVIYAVYFFVITYLSLVSISSEVKIKIDYADKIAHIGIHFINVCLLYIVAYKYKINKTLLLAFLISVIYGIVIEILQDTLTNKRQFDFFDMLANVVGALIAIVFLKLKGKTLVKKI